MAAKLRTRSPHDLRHTYATLLLMDHYSPAYVQKQLCHHSISMTVDIYGHWVPGEGKKDLTQNLARVKVPPGPTLTVAGYKRPQRPQQGIPRLQPILSIRLGTKLKTNLDKTPKQKA